VLREVRDRPRSAAREPQGVPRPQFRQFCCPGCGLLVENEIAVESEPLLVDVELHGTARK